MRGKRSKLIAKHVNSNLKELQKVFKVAMDDDSTPTQRQIYRALKKAWASGNRGL